MKTLGAKPQCLARPDFHKDFASCQACVIEVIRKEPLPFSATDSLGVGGALRMHGPRMGLPPGMGPAGPGAMGGPPGGGGPQWGDRRQAGPMDPRFQDARGGRGGVTGPPGPGARGAVGTRGGGMDDKQWERRGPGAAGGMAAGGRGGSGGRGGGIGSLHRAESRFVIGAVRGDDPVEEKKQKEILATLNKVTPNTLEKLTDHIINDVKLEDQVTLEGLIDKIFDKALTDTHFSEMYSTMCHRVSVNEKTPKFPNPDGGKDIDFRRLLLNKCQVEFEQGCQAMDSVSTQEKEQGLAAGAALPAEEGEADKAAEGKEEGELPQPAVEAKPLTANQLLQQNRAARRRMLGNILFVGNLFKISLITERILHSCIVQLLKEEASPRADDIECLCKLLVTVGHKLDSTNKPEHKQAMVAYFERMKRLAVSPTLDSRIRFTIKDVLEMRENNWVARRKAEGPKKIEDLHREATAELEAQARRDEQERRNARGGGGGYRGDDRRGGGGPPMRGGPPPTRNDDYSRLVAKDEMPRQAMSLSANRQSSTEISLRPQASNSRGAVMGGRTASSALSSAAAARGAGAQDVRVSADPPPPPRSAPHASEARAPAPPPPQALPRMAPADLVTPAKSLVEEYFVNRSTSEAILSMADLRKRGADMAALLYPVLVAALNVRGLGLEERVAPLRELFVAALKEANGGVSSEEFVAGVRLVGCELHRLVEDLPKAPMVLSQFFGEFVADGVLPLAAVLQPVLDVPPSEDDGGTNPPLVDVGAAPDLLLGVMAKIKERLGEASAVSQWTSSGLDALLFWPDFERDNLGRIRAAVGKMGLDFLVAP
ncbi:hypothetical protein V8C86DRAFT_2852062 [Haematococcus lacustris]